MSYAREGIILAVSDQQIFASRNLRQVITDTVCHKLWH